MAEPVHMPREVHVIPVRDRIKHVIGAARRGFACPCGPDVTENGRLTVHHAVDKRELRERKASL